MATERAVERDRETVSSTRFVMQAGSVLGVALAFLALAVPASGGSASGGPTWEPTASLLFPNAYAGGPTVSVNAAGDAVVIWEVTTPESCVDPGCTHTLFAMWRGHGSNSWTAPVKISESSLAITASSRVALDAQGDATAIFLEYSIGDPQGVSGRVRAVAMRDGHWDAPVTLAVGPYLASPSVVVNGAGDALAYWGSHADYGDYHWDAVYRSGPTGHWEKPAVVATGAGATVRAAMDQAGNVLVVSSLGTSVSRSSASKSWSVPMPIAETAGTGSLALAMNARGDAVVVWVTGDSRSLFVESMYRPAGGRWTTPEVLSRRNEDVLYPSVVIDEAGNALAAWTEEPAQFNRSTWTAYRRASRGRWEPEVALDASGQLPMLAVNAGGNVVVVWSETPWTGPGMRASLWPATLGAWTPTQRLGEVGLGGYGAGVDSHGHALVAWSVPSAAGIEMSELTPNGPVLGKLHVPKRGTRGVPITVRVTPAPWGSPLRGAPIWRFGDGTGAKGASVRHVFRRSGSFDVSVAEVDDAGGKTTTSRRVTVRPS